MPGEFAARVPGGSITGWLAGTGPPVLVLHGGPGLSDYTAPLAAELTDAFEVIRYQQRGLAPSVTSGPFDIGQHVADAIAVLDAVGADRAYVVGHSWGGHLAMHLAVRHPGPDARPGGRRSAGRGPRRRPQRHGTEPDRADPAGTGGAGRRTRRAGHGRPGHPRGRPGEPGHRVARILLRTRSSGTAAAADPVGGVLLRDLRLDPGALRPAHPGALAARANRAHPVRPGRCQPDTGQARRGLGRPHPRRPVPDRGLRALPVARAPRVGTRSPGPHL